MKLKKMLSIALAFAMAVSLTACGNSGSSNSSSTGSNDTSSSDPSPSGSGATSTGITAPEGYPDGPITLMCAWAAGGGSDLLSRAVAADAKDYIGVQMNVTNRDGAGGTIGLAEAVDYANDGYNLVFTTSGVFSAQPLLREVEYSIDDFDFICGLSLEPLCIAVPASMGVTTLDEWIEKMNSEGTEAVVGTSGNTGSIPAFYADVLFPTLGLNSYNIINYGGSGEVIPAMLGGEINCAYFHPHEAWPYVESGDFVVLAVSTEERMEEFADFATFKEQGIDHVAGITKGIIAPTGLDPEIRDYLEACIMKIAEEGPNTQTYIESSHLPKNVTTGAEFKEAILQQTEELAEIFG